MHELGSLLIAATWNSKVWPLWSIANPLSKKHKPETLEIKFNYYNQTCILLSEIQNHTDFYNGFKWTKSKTVWTNLFETGAERKKLLSFNHKVAFLKQNRCALCTFYSI